MNQINAGIDFGSTYSMVAKFDPVKKSVEPVIMAEGEPASIPSVVGINKKGQISCGRAAKEQIGKKTVRTFEGFKMLLTETNEKMIARRGYDQETTPRLISKHFLNSLLQGVMNRENCDGFGDVVICVPEQWGKNMENLNAIDGKPILRDILLMDMDIPIRSVRVVTEPEAASAFIAFNYEKETGKRFNGDLLLVDYGGGTLDLTWTQVTSHGKGSMEITYRDSGGAGENHPDGEGVGDLGIAGIAFMQYVIELALRDAQLLAEGEAPNYDSIEFKTAHKDLESQLKSFDRIQELENAFEGYGAYPELYQILDEDPEEFLCLEYGDEELSVTFQHLYLAYREKIEAVLDGETKIINEKIKAARRRREREQGKPEQFDPCHPSSGDNDDFKIALVGGFGTFYLVKKQIAHIYDLDPNSKVDKRTKNISLDKQEQAISLGAALLAEGVVSLKKVSRFSIGICQGEKEENPERLYYGMLYHQNVEPGHPYFIRVDENKPDTPDNRVPFASIYGNILSFAIEYTDRRNHGGLMPLKSAMRDQLRQLPVHGVWNLGFSMDENDILSFHVVPDVRFMGSRNEKGKVIRMERIQNMFYLSNVKEVTFQ